MKELESIFLIEEKQIDNYIEGHKNDFASSLFILQTLYRMIDSLQDNRIREYVVKLDQKFQEQAYILHREEVCKQPSIHRQHPRFRSVKSRYSKQPLYIFHQKI